MASQNTPLHTTREEATGAHSYAYMTINDLMKVYEPAWCGLDNPSWESVYAEAYAEHPGELALIAALAEAHRTEGKFRDPITLPPKDAGHCSIYNGMHRIYALREIQKEQEADILVSVEYGYNPTAREDPETEIVTTLLFSHPSMASDVDHQDGLIDAAYCWLRSFQLSDVKWAESEHVSVHNIDNSESATAVTLHWVSNLELSADDITVLHSLLAARVEGLMLTDPTHVSASDCTLQDMRTELINVEQFNAWYDELGKTS